MRGRVPFGVFLASGLLATFVAGTAQAAPARTETPPSPETREKAAALFGRGTALYRIGDFAHAAPLFEEANRLAPHPNILWNAARARDGAGDYAMAANEYDQYLRDSSETEPDRKDATKALARLSRKLGRLSIDVPQGATVLLDKEPIASLQPYVLPGSHSVVASLGDRTDSQNVTIEIGGSRNLALLGLSSTPPLVAAAPSLATSETVVEKSEARGMSPWVFVGAATLTAAAAGFAIGFGVDTLHARSEFDKAPTTARFEEGRDKQVHTNIAIGISAGLGAITAITGIWLVDWKGRSPRVGVALSPSFTGVQGTF